MKLKIAFLSVLFSVPVTAGDFTLSWTPPLGTEYCYEAGPTSQNLAGYRVYELIADIADPELTTYTIASKVPGTYTYMLTAYDTDGDESRVSASAATTVEAFTTVGGPVYNLLKRENRFVMLVVGDVPKGVACDPTQTVNNRYAVSTSEVQWTSTVRPVVVVADCE